jgi:hypothetical protein
LDNLDKLDEKCNIAVFPGKNALVTICPHMGVLDELGRNFSLMANCYPRTVNVSLDR